MTVHFFKVDILEETVEEVFRRLGWKSQLGRNDLVLVKPNFLKEPRVGVTTDLALIRAVVDQVRDKTSQVYVGETDSAGKDFDSFASRLNLGCPVVNLSRDKTIEVSGKYGVYRLPELALKAKILNLPVLKTHVLTKVSLSVKNLFGLIQDKHKDIYHWKIDKVLFDLYQIFKPPMNLLDGIYAMDGNGPIHGRIRKTNLLAASSNALSLDAAVCQLLGLNPFKVEHLRRLLEVEKVSFEPVEKIELDLEFKIPDTRLPRAGSFVQSLLKTLWKRVFKG